MSSESSCHDKKIVTETLIYPLATEYFCKTGTLKFAAEQWYLYYIKKTNELMAFSVKDNKNGTVLIDVTMM